MSAGEKEAEHSVFDGPSSELIFFFSLEKKLKINRGTHDSLAFVIVKHMFNLRVALLRIKSQRNGQQDGEWDRSKKTRLCKVGL